ncbi:hypothetical protein HDV06_005940 [Boothiomyces sp. JEL0866]|nr:hypothetical protein HDV06_005940 [Boothiomyces sp. JEL0866]
MFFESANKVKQSPLEKKPSISSFFSLKSKKSTESLKSKAEKKPWVTFSDIAHSLSIYSHGIDHSMLDLYYRENTMNLYD